VLQKNFRPHGKNDPQQRILIFEFSIKNNIAFSSFIYAQDVYDKVNKFLGNKLIYQPHHVKDLMDDLSNVHILIED
jgi:hypothetical protein